MQRVVIPDGEVSWTVFDAEHSVVERRRMVVWPLFATRPSSCNVVETPYFGIALQPGPVVVVGHTGENAC